MYCPCCGRICDCQTTPKERLVLDIRQGYEPKISQLEAVIKDRFGFLRWERARRRFLYASTDNEKGQIALKLLHSFDDKARFDAIDYVLREIQA